MMEDSDAARLSESQCRFRPESESIKTFLQTQLHFSRLLALSSKMDQDTYREAQATTKHSLFQKIKLVTLNMYMKTLQQNIVLGETYFRLGSYESAYEHFLCAKSYAQTQKCLTKINISLIFSLLALHKIPEALQLLSQQQSSMIEYESVSLLQIYVKLGRVDRAIELHDTIHYLPYSIGRVSLMLQLYITLIHCYDQKGLKVDAKETFRLACYTLKNLRQYYNFFAYELFQQVYFLLFYSYKNNFLEFRFFWQEESKEQQIIWNVKINKPGSF